METISSLRSCRLLGLLAACVLACLPARAQDLLAAVTVDLSARPVWHYILTSLEPPGSDRHLFSFILPLGARVRSIEAPDFWSFESDGRTFIRWHTVAGAPGWPGDVAPGTSLAGFRFVCDGVDGVVDSLVRARSHTAGGEVVESVISAFAPVGPAPVAVPEPGAGVLAACALAAALAWRLTARRRRGPTRRGSRDGGRW